LLLPPAMFAGPDGQSLDDAWPRDVARALGRPVQVGIISRGSAFPLAANVP
jgi:hypothetical protein